MQKAIVVGATSGIGRQLAMVLAQNGYKVGITGRRPDMLASLQALYPDSMVAAAFDVTNIAKAPQYLQQLADELGGLDLLILSSGTGKININLDTAVERYTNEVNVAGFTAVANWAFAFFERQGRGHLAAITSIAGLRGSRQAPAYFASKGYQINYLEGLRQKAVHARLPVYITDIRPGFVDTAMAAGERLFWVATVEKAADQIYAAIEKKKDIVYITKRWRLAAVLLKLIPGVLYKRL